MKRTIKLIGLANELVRPSPFQIVTQSSEVDRGRKTYYYGKTKVAVHGYLTEYDRGVFLCILEMAKQHKEGGRFDFTLVDIAKTRGDENPYVKKALDAIGKSIDRLLGARIRIKPTNGEKGISAAFNFIQGWLNSDCVGGNIAVSPYLDVIRDLSLGNTNLDLNLYFKLRSAIARSLYSFLESQQNFYTKGQKYEIRLDPLLTYINYDRKDRQWWKTHQVFKKACAELVKANILQSGNCDNSKYHSEGGLWTFKKKFEAFEKVPVRTKRTAPTKSTIQKSPIPDSDFTRLTDSDFARFWEAYPKKEKRQQALSEWQRLKDRPEMEMMLGILEEHKRSPLWNAEQGRFINLPQNWLKKKLWNQSPADMKYHNYSQSNGKRVCAHGARSQNGRSDSQFEAVSENLDTGQWTHLGQTLDYNPLAGFSETEIWKLSRRYVNGEDFPIEKYKEMVEEMRRVDGDTNSI